MCSYFENCISEGIVYKCSHIHCARDQNALRGILLDGWFYQMEQNDRFFMFPIFVISFDGKQGKELLNFELLQIICF